MNEPEDNDRTRQNRMNKKANQQASEWLRRTSVNRQRSVHNRRAHKRQTVIKQLLLLHRALRQKSLIIVKQANSRLHVQHLWLSQTDTLAMPMLSCHP